MTTHTSDPWEEYGKGKGKGRPPVPEVADYGFALVAICLIVALFLKRIKK